jgi:long-subunit fatty acid transport protein
MSAYLDGQIDDPYYTQSVGPQNDGTYNKPWAATAATPYDAGGGPTASYAPQIMDIFKFGVGVWQQQQNLQAQMDYRRFEATQSGAYQQGQATNQVGNNMNMLILIAMGVGLVILIAD